MYADLTGNRKKYRIKSRYGNNCQSEMVSDAGKSLARQIREVLTVEYWFGTRELL